MSYGGYHTRQEQEDALATRIDNPNRVGSGFINLGPMQRISQPTGAANWQTASLVSSAAPPGVSDIWNKQTPQAQAPPGVPPAMASRPPAVASQMPPQSFAQPGGGRAFAAPPQRDATAGVNGMFNSFSIDPATQARALAAQQAQGAQAAAQAQQARSFSSMRPAPPQPFMNGSGGAPLSSAPAPPQSLMSMLNAPPPPPPTLNSGFAGLGNGSVPTSRVQAAFTPMPPVAQCQAPGQSSASFGAGAGYRGTAPNSRAAPPTQPAAPKTLSSAADYGAAAAAWKPPSSNSTQSSHSVARKAESADSARKGGAGRGAEPAAEWECSRCTFLNNGALWECEMCGFERPGRESVAAASSARAAKAHDEDAGWKPAGKVERKGAGSAQNAPSAAGKSKAQAKNEKRRAKKRDGAD